MNRKGFLACLVAVLLTVATAILPSLSGAPVLAASKAPLSVAVDATFPPFAFRNASGQLTGFAIDLAAAAAKEMGLPGIRVTGVNYSAIFAGLFAKHYDVVVAPTNITLQRAQEMLFTQPYMPTGLGFVIKAGSPSLRTLADLKGKAVSVNSGSLSDTWATQNAARYGFTVQRYATNPDAVQAVLEGRAYANITEVSVARYVAKINPALKVGYILYNGNNFGWAVRKNDVQLRDKLDDALACLKFTGVLAKLYKKWFGSNVPVGTSMTTVYVGYGAPGFPGYQLTFHVPHCASR